MLDTNLQVRCEYEKDYKIALWRIDLQLLPQIHRPGKERWAVPPTVTHEEIETFWQIQQAFYLAFRPLL
jgi:hypothetical protein